MDSSCIQNSMKDIEEAMEELLPQIELSLKQELFKQIQQQLSQQIDQQIGIIQQKAQSQFLQAKQQLRKQAIALKVQQSQELNEQIQYISQQNQKSKNIRLNYLQEKYLSQNFHTEIMNHQMILQFQTELFNQLKQMHLCKYKQIKERRERQIVIKLQNKQHKQRKQSDKVIKERIFGKATNETGIEDLKKDIDLLKIGIASMRSQYNIKIKKIDDQIKDYRKKIKEKQSKQNLKLLEEQLESIRGLKEAEKIMNSPNQDFSKNFSHLDESNEFSLFKNPLYQIDIAGEHYDAQYIADKQLIIESESEYQQSSKNFQYQKNISPTFQCSKQPSPSHYQFDNHSNEDIQQDQWNSSQTEARILELDVCKLLRANWQESENSKNIVINSQNNNLASNKGTRQNEEPNSQSKFYTKYMIYLENMNRNCRTMHKKEKIDKNNKNGKKDRLSINTRQTIIKKIGMMNAIY